MHGNGQQNMVGQSQGRFSMTSSASQYENIEIPGTVEGKRSISAVGAVFNPTSQPKEKRVKADKQPKSSQSGSSTLQDPVVPEKRVLCDTSYLRIVDWPVEFPFKLISFSYSRGS